MVKALRGQAFSLLFTLSLSTQIKVHLTPKKVFRLINSMYIKKLNSKIFLVFNVALASYRDLNLQNANKMMSIQES